MLMVYTTTTGDRINVCVRYIQTKLVDVLTESRQLQLSFRSFYKRLCLRFFVRLEYILLPWCALFIE